MSRREDEAANLLDWAYGFLCVAKPMIEKHRNGAHNVEAREWLNAFEGKFYDAYHEWLRDYCGRDRSGTE